MPSRPRLTKSLYVLGLECPTKIHYQRHPETYANALTDDPFLRELARGGYQVGALAKAYHPTGIDLEGLGVEEALERTREELARDKTVLFEAAIEWNGLLVRADILRKNGPLLELIEVKAKSYDRFRFDGFLTQREPRHVRSEWTSYLSDVAFQAYVISRAYPSLKVEPMLMLADKSKVASVEGLNQLFRLVKDAKGRTRAVPREGLTVKDLGDPVLVALRVGDEVRFIHETNNARGRGFEEEIEEWKNAVLEDRPVPPEPGRQCKKCEFRVAPEDAGGKRSGFAECWKGRVPGVEAPFVFDVWNFRSAGRLMDEGKLLMTDLEEEDVAPQPREDGPGLSQSERQWLQISRHKSGDGSEYLDRDGLAREMRRWKYPLHLIDFETCAAALPFHSGRAPYETIAFQFSHHVLHEDGRLEHKGQWLSDRRGAFPNFDFIRALRDELVGDEGTIFRYAIHENTVLMEIFRQLLKPPPEIYDESDGLIRFIKWITKDPERPGYPWDATREMVDLHELVKRYYYHPRMGGSCSIKAVLPAVLSESRYLQERYSRPVYGKGLEIPSLNFERMAWVQRDAEGRVMDPYRLLPPVFDGRGRDELDRLLESDEIADGGAAMSAWSKMQFGEMTDAERAQVRVALLKYCELDTLAMAMLVEHWREACR